MSVGYEIVPLEKLPPRRIRMSEFDEVIQKALDLAPDEAVKMKILNRKPESVSVSLRLRIRRMGYVDKVHVETRGKEVYLLKGPARPYAGKTRGRGKQT
jgi:hypothetical protein